MILRTREQARTSSWCLPTMISVHRGHQRRYRSTLHPKSSSQTKCSAQLPQTRNWFEFHTAYRDINLCQNKDKLSVQNNKSFSVGIARGAFTANENRGDPILRTGSAMRDQLASDWLSDPTHTHLDLCAWDHRTRSLIRNHVGVSCAIDLSTHDIDGNDRRARWVQTNISLLKMYLGG